jgi:hypothetical protein
MGCCSLLGQDTIGYLALQRYLVSLPLPFTRTPGADVGGTIDVRAARPAIAGGK